MLLLAVALVVGCAACKPAGPPPSIVVVVLDTTRADAVSAYGYVEGTTPHIDALARTGLLYEHAFANSNWTLPSHATLFTGLLPMQHGVHTRHHRLDSVPTMAKLLRSAGYETVAISQNPWLQPAQGLTQDFETYRFAPHAVVETVQQWLARRGDDRRPFFLFLNLMDAHSPYLVRDTNPFLPAGVSADEARAVVGDVHDYLCNLTRQERRAEILRGLYLGNVHAADASLGAVLSALQASTAAPIVVVTSDHGEHFGEQRFVNHEIGVHHALTHIPLVVHGLPGVAPARVDAAVQLADIMPSVLTWAGVVVPNGLPGEPLPTVPGKQSNRTIVAEFYDGHPEFLAELPAEVRAGVERTRQHCGPADRVDGNMRAVIRLPYALQWYDKYPPQLFDLTSDRAEERDLAATMPDLVNELTGHMQRTVASATKREAPRATLDAAQIERLRALGYLGGEAAQGHSAPAQKPE